MKRFALFGVLVLTACAVEPVSLVRDGAVVVQTSSSAAARVWWADVQSIGQETVVTGEVIRHRDWPADRPGHVDVQVVATDGRSIGTTHAELVPVPTASADSRRLAFRVTLAQRPPPDSIVRVIHLAQERTHGTS